jgi:hypothetical protein
LARMAQHGTARRDTPQRSCDATPAAAACTRSRRHRTRPAARSRHPRRAAHRDSRQTRLLGRLAWLP